MPEHDHGIRVLCQQPALPAFRVPFFRALAARPGIDFHLSYSTNPVPNVEPDGFDASHREIRHLPGGLMWDAIYMEMIKHGAADRPWDAQVMTWNTRYLSLVPQIRRAHKLGQGVVLWGHGYSKNESPARAWLRLKTARMADAVVLYSESVAQSYIDRGMPADKVFVALNSLDPTPIQAARERCLADEAGLAAFQREHGLAADGGRHPVILYVSRFEIPNRTPMLVEATKLLLPEFPELRTVIIGKGEDEANINETCERLGVGGRVIRPGPVYGEDSIAPWFCSADVFCYPQNIGLSILHAFNHALPVVTSDKIESQNPEIEALRDGANGLLYEHGSVEALAETLAKLLRDEAQRKRLGAEAHATATTRYNTDRMADGMEAAIRFAAGRSTRRS